MKRQATAAQQRAPARLQLTVRNVPAQVAKTLRSRASRERKSLNSVLVEALSGQAGGAAAEPSYHDLDWLAGTWEPDPAFDAAIAAQDQIDESVWR